MQKWFFLCGLIFICEAGFGQDKTAYIQTYKHIAISEMMRTGIPASIKLAQAILESACGQSDLACKANNHFGIKCGNDWKGKSYKKEDDDYEEGKLVKSCFREFSSAYDSYIAHSDFLTDPAKSKRYGSLFELQADDYKGWAKGLSRAGYATDPQYAQRLIDIIEKYELYRFDKETDEPLVSNSPKKAVGLKLFNYNNDVKYVLAQSGDTPQSIAERNDVTIKQVIRYNDDIDNEDQLLTEGSYVYLQPKRNQNNGKQKVHLIKPGEDMVALSQKYGIKLEALLKRNGLNDGDIPAPNQKIVLKGKSDKPLRTINPYDVPAELPDQKPAGVISQADYASADIKIDVEPLPVKHETTAINKVSAPVQSTKMHTVIKGDTLFRIATQHGISVEELKKMNNLSADTISIGQTLMLK